jgi:biopolymer transport protein ExbD
LTLTSLVDLFTNIVLFLLYNFSAEGTSIPSAERLKLPQAFSDTTPRTAITVMITQSDILLEGKKVAEVGFVMQEEQLLIENLKSALDYEAERGKFFAGMATGKGFEGRVTILGDQQIPFKLIEKVMFTCSQSEFSQIDLGVIPRESA